MATTAKKTVMSESYKDALNKKEEDSFTKKARGMAAEYHRDQKAHEAKRNSVLWKREQKIKGMKAELRKVEARQHKAEEAVSANTHFMMGVALLALSALTFVVVVILRGSNHGTATIVALILAVVLLFASAFTQAKGLEMEIIARQSKEMADDLRRQIKKMENPSLR
ncbi:hypothetical protein IK112_02815 [Candidatus Saccharibacteria bacterium]|nr:hypothetical protein [Candidatus Saccharibacteria bacterium]